MTNPSRVDEMDDPPSFGEWLMHRRKELDLTRAELAERANCSMFAVRKIETGERRPSKQLAELIAQALEIPSEDRATFIRVARGELSMEKLPSPAHSSFHDFPPAVKPSQISGNLPRMHTPFIGREPEIAALNQLLQDPQCSLLTLVGYGGIGKTRLAIESAHHSKDLFSDGVWFVPLAALTSPLQLVQAIAGAIDFQFQDPTKPLAQLIHHLKEKKALLILDNAEHLLEGVGVFTEILNNCQQVKFLVTSRERLNLLSEWVFEIQGLPVPPNDQVEQFEAYSSVALFLQGARRAVAGYELREADRKWILKICQILEGMPLGIELSAAWVGLLTCQEIAQETEQNLDFLTVSMRDLPERHRSLRATLDHSWKLLNSEEKQVLSQLSVFHGSFRREAAKEICGASLTVLSSLKNKNLLNRTGPGYYGLHDVIHQYAELKLNENPGEAEKVRDRHAEYYVSRLAEWERTLKSPRQMEIFNEMALEIGNLVQGWRRMVRSYLIESPKPHPFRPELFHPAIFSLSLFLETRSRSWEAIDIFQESVECMRIVRSTAKNTEETTRFDGALGHVTTYLGLHHYYILEYEKARKYLQEAIQLLENAQLKVISSEAQVMLAWIHYKQGRLQKSANLLEQSRAIFREKGEAWWYLLSIINLAITYYCLGNLEASEALYQEGSQLVDPGDLRVELPLRNGIAYVQYLQKDFAKAEQLLQENLELSYSYESIRFTSYVFIDLAQVALATHRVELAEKYLGNAVDLLREVGESNDLAMISLYIGKCFITRMELKAARAQFRKVIEVGLSLDAFHLVYWGLANIARTYLSEGKTEKAFEISLVIRQCHVEYKQAQDEGVRLFSDLQAEFAMRQVEDRLPTDPSAAEALAKGLAKSLAEGIELEAE